MHPWEDWAETWAHYLHMIDTLETRRPAGIALLPQRADELVVKQLRADAASPDAPFDRLIDNWFPLTYVLNNLNRALGLPDGTPSCCLHRPSKKLRFVHDTIVAAATS